MLKEESKLIVGFNATTATNGDTVVAQFDCVGMNRAVIDLWHGGVTNAAVADVPVILRLAEGDTSAAYTDIDAFKNAVGFTATPAATVVTNTNCYRFDVDLRGRKRWLKLTWQPPVAQGATVLTAQCVAHLYKAEAGLETAAKQGVLQLITG